MKFTKEELVENLKKLLTNDGKKPLRMSERTLKEQSEDLINLLADDEIELVDFVDKIKPTFERINSNVEHDVSDAIAKLKPAEPKKPEPVTDAEPKKDNPNEAVLETLQKQIAELIADRDKAQKENAASEKRKAIKAYLKGKNVENDEWIEGIMGIASIDGDTDVEKQGETLLGLYNKQNSKAGDYTPTRAGDTGKQGSTFDDVAQLLKQRRDASENV